MDINAAIKELELWCQQALPQKIASVCMSNVHAIRELSVNVKVNRSGMLRYLDGIDEAVNAAGQSEAHSIRLRTAHIRYLIDQNP